MKRILFFTSLLILITACKQSEDNNLFYVDPNYSPYIAAYSTGLVSNNSPIRVVLQTPITDSVFENNLLEFSPKIKGTYSVEKGNTLVFTPDEQLKHDQLYRAKLKLIKLNNQVPDSLKIFPFNFQTLKQDFDLEITSVQSVDQDKESYEIKGNITSNDHISNEELENIFYSRFNDKNIVPTWNHKGNVHEFTFTQIRRGNSESTLDLTFDGEDAGGDQDIKEELVIPKKEDLKLIQIKAYSQPEQYIAVNFSQPIKQTDFSGMFELEGTNLKSILLDGNIVKLYPAENLTGKYQLTIWNGIEDIFGNKTQEKFTQEVTLNSLRPKVEFVGNGNIVTENKGVKIPFKAIGLKAVDVKITKIFNNNIHQFFQRNHYDETEKLKLVGREYYTTTLNLTQEENFNAQQAKVYQIDISKITKKDPAAIYNVELSFKQNYSMLDCNGNEPTEELNDDYENDQWNKDANLYHYYDYDDYDDDYYYREDYDWRQRDNPCSSSYYTEDKWVNKNVLATNLGLTAKISEERKMYASLSNLLDVKPIGGAELIAYDLQNQEVGKGKTDNEGLCVFDLSRKPFLIRAEKGKEVVYLRVYEGSSLNYSTFDIDGTKLSKGLDGFIYGERGVWRPGDSLFLTFIPKSQQELPKNIPAIFKFYNTDHQQIDQKVVLPKGDNFYVFKTKTDADGKTGNYYLEVKYAGAKFSKSLKVETIKPNRLKVNVVFPSEVLTAQSPPIQIDVNWLTGGIAKGLKVTTEATIRNQASNFKGYENYTFDDPSKSISNESKVIFTGTTDENGRAIIPNTWQPKTEAPGKLSVGFFTKVFEKGGDFSTSYVTHDYSPYMEYVGLNIATDDDYYGSLPTETPTKISIASVDLNGKPVSSKVQLSLYKISTNWWYNSGSNDLAYYVNDMHTANVFNKEIQTQNGKGTYNLKIDKEDWGSYFVRVKDLERGHTAGQVVWFDSFDGGNRYNSGEESPTILTINTDKDSYKVGETATVTIPQSLEGKALMSLENGSSVIRQNWMNTSKGSTTKEVKITEEMAPNFYVNISMIQPHQNTVNDLPIRMFGVVNVKVTNPKSELKPVIQAPEKILPQSKYSVKVSEKNGMPMSYTLAVVDEGLLDITNFKTPDIYEFFNHKQSLGVKTWDVYDYVLGAYGGRIESVFAIGGDQALQNSNKEKINRFKPVVTFLGPFTLGKNASKNHQLEMANYIGSVRVMVVASNATASGSAQDEITVKKPLMTLTSLPRTLTPGDEITIPVNVFAGENAIKNVQVSLKTNDKVQLVSPSSQSISFAKQGEQIVEFKVRVPYVLGKATFQINASSGSYQSSEDIEIEVRAPNPYITKTELKQLDGASTEFTMVPDGLSGTNTTRLEFSSLPISNFVNRMDYLIEYPHGCIEQTVSGLFPQLYLSDITNLNSSQKSKIQRNINYGIELLNRFQLTNGGMSYWPGNSNLSDWGSVYAMHFLIEAEKKGYKVPSYLKNNLLNYLYKSSKDWDYYSTQYFYYKQTQAYKLYVLSLGNKPNMSEMNRLKTANLDKTTNDILANAYYLARKSQLAESLYKDNRPLEPFYSFNFYTYGSSLRDEAMRLLAATDIGIKDDALKLVQDVSSKLNTTSWYSTQTTAMALVAISNYLNGNSSKNVGVNAVVNINGKSRKVQTAEDLFVIEMPSDGPQTIKVDKIQSGPLFVSVSQKGIPTSVLANPKSNNLNMSVAYQDLDGNSIDPSRLSQNTDFQAVVTITNPGFYGIYHDMALTHIFPSGWEIVNKRMYAGNDSSSGNLQYQDYRDDRVLSYFSLPPSNTISIRVFLNATYKGDYRLPSVQCEAMYNNDIYAYTAGQRVSVY